MLTWSGAQCFVANYPTLFNRCSIIFHGNAVAQSVECARTTERCAGFVYRKIKKLMLGRNEIKRNKTLDTPGKLSLSGKYRVPSRSCCVVPPGLCCFWFYLFGIFSCVFLCCAENLRKRREKRRKKIQTAAIFLLVYERKK